MNLCFASVEQHNNCSKPIIQTCSMRKISNKRFLIKSPGFYKSSRYYTSKYVFIIFTCLLFTTHYLALAQNYNKSNCILNTKTNEFDNEKSRQSVKPSFKLKCVKDDEIIIGYLANFFGHYKVRNALTDSGAIAYAIDEVNRSNLLGNRTIKFVASDTEGISSKGTEAILYQQQKGAIAFIGPDSTCEVEASVATALNLPMISYKCSDQRVSNKQIFKTFARTFPSNTGLIKSVIALLKYYKWFRFSVIYKDTEIYRKMVENLVKNVKEEKKNSFMVTSRRSFPNFSECCEKQMPCCNGSLTEIIEETSKTTRIYVFFGDRVDIQDYMNLLKKHNYLSKNYFVIFVDTQDPDQFISSRYVIPSKPEIYSIKDLEEAFRSCLVITLTPPNEIEYQKFAQKANEYGKNMFCLNNEDNSLSKHITIYACYMYDAIWLYARAISELIRLNECLDDGIQVIQKVIDQSSYTSICGSMMQIDSNGDVEGNYTVLSLKDTPVELQNDSRYLGLNKISLQVGMFEYNKNESPIFRPKEEIDWINNKAPLDMPVCGFDNSLCEQKNDFTYKKIIFFCLVLFLIAFSLTIFFVYRTYKHERQIEGLLWKINLNNTSSDELHYSNYTNLDEFNSICDTQSNKSFSENNENIIKFTDTVFYNGRIVAVKELYFEEKPELSIDLKKEMKIIKNLHHDNLIQFVGADLEKLSHHRIYLATEYCDKGSLQDFLAEEKFQLNSMFIASLVFDLLSALSYLHKSELKFHGNLKSSNCLITSRIMLKVTDFGLHNLRAAVKKFDEDVYMSLLWTSPEQLRLFDLLKNFHKPIDKIQLMQKGDIYSFAIILHEIIIREGPFNIKRKIESSEFQSLDSASQNIIENVKRIPYVTSQSPQDYFRPIIPINSCEQYIEDVMRFCWSEKPDDRPDIFTIKNDLNNLRKGLKPNIMDNMIKLLEDYNKNLEVLVNQRTKQVETLLYSMLPKTVADTLMQNKPVVPDFFESVTIFFSDIVGFTTIANNSKPIQIVNFLNDLYTLFDDIIKGYDVYKVETIGDAYMVGSGFPIKNNDEHVKQIADMALQLLDSVKNFKIKHKPDETLQLRIGIHTGAVVAGVVGKTMPRYCLFGDTVNFASRMESNGQALKIHISNASKELLEKKGKYVFERRGLVELKGIGKVQTYWLIRNDEQQSFSNLRKRKKLDFIRRASSSTVKENSVSQRNLLDFSVIKNALKLSNQTPSSMETINDDTVTKLVPEYNYYFNRNKSEYQNRLCSSYLDFSKNKLFKFNHNFTDVNLPMLGAKSLMQTLENNENNINFDDCLSSMNQPEFLKILFNKEHYDQLKLMKKCQPNYRKLESFNTYYYIPFIDKQYNSSKQLNKIIGFEKKSKSCLDLKNFRKFL